MQHHIVAHINAHMGNPACIIGPHEKHQVARLGIGYRGGDIVEPLGAQPPGVAQPGIGQHIAHEAGTVEGGLRAAPAPDIRVSQVFLRLGDKGGEPLIRQVLGGDTLRANRERCVGMAANMIGVKKNIIIVNMGFIDVVMFNPVIVSKHDMYETEEGCLSLDGVRKTTRYQEIEVEYYDFNWKKQRQKLSGWTAQICQHEIDHLSGKII